MNLIFEYLENQFKGRKVELSYSNGLELLVSTILSAQCTDERVNQVTPALFKKYRSAEDFARADLLDVERLIHSTGFYRAKSRNIVRCCQQLVEKHGGKVPDTMEDLIALSGVWRKTASVILGNLHGKPAIVVDTHVKRVSNRLGLTRWDHPDKIEQDLAQLLPRKAWTMLSHQLLLHGRYVCKARRPDCSACMLYNICPWDGKDQFT